MVPSRGTEHGGGHDVSTHEDEKVRGEATQRCEVTESAHPFDRDAALARPGIERLGGRLARPSAPAQGQIAVDHPHPFLAEPGARLVDERGPAVEDGQVDSGIKESAGNATLPLRGVDPRIARDEDGSHASWSS